MKLSLNTNIGSLRAQNQLLKASEKLQTSFERLSSGLRINRASDDPAGLAMTGSLQADSRLMAQAVRNVNDGISLLTVAESALKELNNILGRQAELAQQAANGTYTFQQRQALNNEANALVGEFNRIIGSSEFNGVPLFNASPLELKLQLGYDNDGSIGFDIGAELARTVGDGTFAARVSYATAAGVRFVALGDVNNDNILDMVSSDSAALTATIFLGLGNGSFASTTSVTVGNAYALTMEDVNNDGNIDIVSADTAGSKVRVLLGRGNGTFQDGVSYAAGLGPVAISLRDLNDDGAFDIVVASNSGDTASILMGNGDGTFSAYTSIAVGLKPYGVALSDINGDEKLDIVVSNRDSDSISVLFGKGDGSFSSGITVATDDAPHEVKVGDVNGDGINDIVVANRYSANINVLMGNGNGTFRAKVALMTGVGCRSVAVADLNGDGYLDIATADQFADSATVLIGNGNGTFKKSVTYYAGEDVNSIAIGDLNNDGALDIATANFTENSVAVLLANTREVSTTPYFNINTRQGALDALDAIGNTSQQISRELGNIGAQQSRLSYTVNYLQTMRENYIAANSKIVDADIADEVAQMVRQQILQQAITAVLAQANQQTALVLKLLK